MSDGGSSYQPVPGAPTVASVLVNKGNAPFYLDTLLTVGAAAAASTSQGQVNPAQLDGRNHYKDLAHPDTVRSQSYEDKARAEMAQLASAQAEFAVVSRSQGR
jgi:hypothetical protein